MAKKVFIIEDDVNILYSLQAKFRVEGYDLMIANGLEKEEIVIENISKFKPDFVVLDLILPRIDGFGLIAKLKEKFPKTKVFVFTNLSDKDSEERGVKLGADYYLFKNHLNIDEFVEKVNKILSNTKK